MTQKKYLVTGAAGFIGSTLVDRLLRDGHTVVGIDNFSTGQRRFLEKAQPTPRFTLIEIDLLHGNIVPHFAGVDGVFHLAANADVRFGTDAPRRDLEQNTIVTHNVLEAMRQNGVTQIGFSSTGSVYGEARQIPTPEDGPFPIQTSLYGASKLAGEGLIAAYAEGFGFKACIFRFVSVLGPRYTHGHVFDFVQQLKKDPANLRVLGNGKQRKSYMHVDDCVDAILLATEKSTEKVGVFNLGCPEYCEVNDSIGWITARMGLNPQLNYTGGERGWIGDNPFIFLDVQKILALGWNPKYTIRQGVEATVDFLTNNLWVYEARS
ncbi:MAG: NAD-dependent epimerase/dehydratase family protein [Alphaproteobacteria bacterium]|nr:NAD-dependent epimerase/dehydratase family protein [Alphaproteobacteria bacterium]NDC55691.1 NAD-dependent epimerase/dehydratase family protein [Alphaproteobacteria bacterium]NDG05077.1 NAD-dependent epimerase/dehydratase family protein [Alphaproteobacteria bacterium]